MENSQAIKGTSSSQQIPKIKPIFNNKAATWRCAFLSDITYITKYKPKMLSKISISRLCSENIGPNGIRGLRKGLAELKKAASITFDTRSCNAKQLAFFFDSTNHWKKISFIGWERQENFEDLHRGVLKSCFRLGKYKNLSAAPFSLSSIQDVGSKMANRLSRQFRQLNKPKSISLSVPFDNDGSFLNGKSIRSLHSVSLNFSRNTSTTEKQLSIITSSLQQCRHLERLNLVSFLEYKIESSDAQIWTSFFQNTTSPIKNLLLFLCSHDAQHSDPIKSFIRSLRHLKHLTSLNLTLLPRLSSRHPLAFLEEILLSLFTDLQVMTKLELRLNLKSFPFLKNSTLKSFALALQSLKDLKNLDVQLPYLQSPDEGLVILAYSLKGLNHLETLHVRLSDHDLSKRSLELFSNSIAHHQLTSFSQTRVQASSKRDSGTFTIKSGLSKLVSLWKNNALAPSFLDLGKFSMLSTLDYQPLVSNISAQEWKQFSTALINLNNLSSLSLTLSKLEPAQNYEGLQNLLASFKDLRKLTCLNLTFKKQVCDLEISILASYLAGCQNLTSLRLVFYRPNQLEDSSLRFLLGGMKGMRALESLVLQFWKRRFSEHVATFGDEAVSEFLKGLTVLKSLQKLNFSKNSESYSLRDTPLPPNLECYQNLRRLTSFIVNDSRFI